jgi:lysyl-tRNA synthetase class 2
MDDIRLQKAKQIREQGGAPYAARFDRSHLLAEAKKLSEGTEAAVAGRIMLWRQMGGMTFATLQDQSGRLQIALKADELGEAYDRAQAQTDLGDIIGIKGTFFLTKKGEPTIMAKEWTMLSKALRQPPEKWHGLADRETAWRQRYLDLISNQETMDRFRFRSRFLRSLREFYWRHDFEEVETPVLVNAASGAIATPFTTHHDAYDLDVFLRIATETFLKECVIGGYDRVFEIGRVFRNEGLDPSHLQDFTLVEHYAAYWDYEANMRFTEEMLPALLKDILGTTKVSVPDRDGNLTEVDFSPPWPRVTLREAVKNACGIDVGEAGTADDLRAMMKSAGVTLDVPVTKLGHGNLMDQLWKKVGRPGMVQPAFITEHPVELSPLARRSDKNPAVTDRFQLVVGGWEIVNAYSELIDPADQAERFAAQIKARAGGDTEAHGKDDAFVKALEYGCPPVSGWGMGVDRVVALLTQQQNLRDVVLFPLMKPEGSGQPAQKAKSDKPAGGKGKKAPKS